MLEEEGAVIRGYNAVHEEKFQSSWLREHLVGEEGRRKKEVKRKEKRVEEKKRKGEKEENETVTVERRCVGFVSAEAFDIFSQGEGLESCGGFSWVTVGES